MAHDVTRLAERNKLLDKRHKLSKICELMVSLNISVSDIVEHMTAHSNQFRHACTADRLSEIGKARAAGKKQLETLAKARQARKDSVQAKKAEREQFIENKPNVNLTIEL